MREKERKRETERRRGEAKLGASSTSLPGGHQVDGVPPVLIVIVFPCLIS